MKTSLLSLLIVLSSLISAQTISLIEGISINEINDRRLVRIDDASNSQFLGKIEIIGNLQDESRAFNSFYEKAKIVGANSYTFHPEVDLNGDDLLKDSKTVSLYYTPEINAKPNKFYVFGSNKSQKVLITGKTVDLPLGTYLEGEISNEANNYISTRRILGSRINLYYKENQPEQYYQILTGGIRSDNSGVTGGLVLKTGDIVMLEKSFANFLTLFYKKKLL